MKDYSLRYALRMLGTILKTGLATTASATAVAGAWIYRGIAAHRRLIPEVIKHARDLNEPGEQITLPDGRTFGYLLPENFDPNGRVSISIHGTPGSRVDGFHSETFIKNKLKEDPDYWDSYVEGDELFKKYKLQQVTIDRWGVGLSSYHEGPLSDIADDVTALCDHLGVDKFMVDGASGGGPYLAACAACIPEERLVGTMIGCPVGPHHLKFDVKAAEFLRTAPSWLYATFLTLQSLEMKSEMTEKRKELTAKKLIDVAVSENCKKFGREKTEFLMFMLGKSVYFQHGIAAGLAERHVRYIENWGFEVADMGRTFILAASDDQNTPVGHAHWYKQNSNVSIKEYPDYGHFSISEHPTYMADSLGFMNKCFEDRGL